jgi:hypothetical protein
MNIETVTVLKEENLFKFVFVFSNKEMKIFEKILLNVLSDLL